MASRAYQRGYSELACWHSFAQHVLLARRVPSQRSLKPPEFLAEPGGTSLSSQPTRRPRQEHNKFKACLGSRVLGYPGELSETISKQRELGV